MRAGDPLFPCKGTCDMSQPVQYRFDHAVHHMDHVTVGRLE
jgi:hypothetical protein